jgi:hypothetical protein
VRKLARAGKRIREAVVAQPRTARHGPRLEIIGLVSSPWICLGRPSRDPQYDSG